MGTPNTLQPPSAQHHTQITDFTHLGTCPPHLWTHTATLSMSQTASMSSPKSDYSAMAQQSCHITTCQLPLQSQSNMHTLPISVTLTPPINIPDSSSTTATLLTPSSLISFIASDTVATELAATTAVWMLSSGNASSKRDLDRIRWRDDADADEEEDGEEELLA